MSRRMLGIDLGGTKTLAAIVVDGGAQVLDTEQAPTPRDAGAAACLTTAVEVAHSLIQRHGAVEAVGIGFAGLIDPSSGVVDSSVILPGWEGFALRDELAAALDLRCVADNDATAAGFGEHCATGRPAATSMMLLTVGTGIGGALILNGSLYRGATGTAAEFGNTTIDWRGEECPSGNRGCLNSLASGTAMLRHAALMAGEHPTSMLAEAGPELRGEDLMRAFLAEDAAAVEVVERGARALGTAIANFINVLNPDRVVLTGGVLDLGERYLECIRAEAGARAFALPFEHAVITAAVHGAVAGAHGAACLAFEEFA